MLEPQAVFRFSTLADGNMAWRWGEAGDVLANRNTWLKSLGIDPRHVALASLVHGDAVREVGAADLGRGMLAYDAELPDADILVTNLPGAFLMMVVADCLAIGVVDRVQGAIGLAHAGHPGVNIGVPGKLVKAMVELYGSQPENLEVFLSPARDTHQALYDDEFMRTRFTANFWPRYTIPSGDAERPWKVDWIQAALDQMRAEGIIVPKYPEDTVTGQYFSHRRSEMRGEPEGRLGVVVGIV